MLPGFPPFYQNKYEPPTQYAPPQYTPPPNLFIGTQLNPTPPMGINNPPMPFPSEPVPTTKHIHPLFPQNSYSDCKICKKLINGGPGFVCRACELVLCYNCFQNIYHGKKFESIHPHPLTLRVRPSWKCAICRRNYSDAASFFCGGCNFDACSLCYIGEE